MKKLMLVLCALICAAVLSGCSQNAASPQSATPAPETGSYGIPQDVVGESDDTIEFDFDSGDYDPSLEENWDEDPGLTGTAAQPAETSPTPPLIAAGATPPVIDPIDKPTPTPAPALSFNTYVTYDATKLRLSFQAPDGWEIDDSLPDTYVLTNPNNRVSFKAGYVITAKAVSTDYSTNDLNREVKGVLNEMRADYSSFSPSNTAARTLFDKAGRYADFTGTLKGTEIQVWGRVHAVTVNKTLVIVRMVAPLEYRNVYKNNVYPKFRETVKFTR